MSSFSQDEYYTGSSSRSSSADFVDCSGHFSRFSESEASSGSTSVNRSGKLSDNNSQLSDEDEFNKSTAGTGSTKRETSDASFPNAEHRKIADLIWRGNQQEIIDMLGKDLNRYYSQHQRLPKAPTNNVRECCCKPERRSVSGVVLVHDITKPAKLCELRRWKRYVDQHMLLPNGSQVPCILLANKIDLQENGAFFNTDPFEDMKFTALFKTSAKDGTNVENAFNHLIVQMLMNESKSQMAKAVALRTQYKQKEEGNRNCMEQIN
ncbi:hypothetical protein C0J52_11423 [Blattella germanica]|nr:hypothetical protein C0J52_11423 [Blattella germanica]